MNSQRKKRKSLQTLDISSKVNRVLPIILIAFILVILRIWHLGVIQHDKKLEESRRPQRRVVLEPAKRATIADRFEIPLSTNKMQYNATFIYSHMRHIPSIAWGKNAQGERIRRYKKKEYITKLSHTLGTALHLEPERIEDLIHAKGALYGQRPLSIKEDISEEEYYRLKIMEKDWPGLQVHCLPKRFYPHGKLGGDVIGYMGAINRQEYEHIMQETKLLQGLLVQYEENEDVEMPPAYESIQQIKTRLKDLQEHAYTLHDQVGKAGIEGKYEQELRGYQGQKSYYADPRGDFLRELPGAREPLAGKKLLLTISKELQEYAEKLLAQNERIRVPRLTTKNKVRFVNMPEKQPWIKGGAIVAIEPSTGDILALASYPRYNPNDFIPGGTEEEGKQRIANIRQWFESETYLADIWDQKRFLEREKFDDLLQTFYEEKISMTWMAYLSFILPKENPVRAHLEAHSDISFAIEAQKIFDELLASSGQTDAYALMNTLYSDHTPYRLKENESIHDGIRENLALRYPLTLQLKGQLDKHLSTLTENYDKVLYLDLCRILADHSLFSEELFAAIGSQTNDGYRKVSAASVQVLEAVRVLSKNLHRDIHFKPWREKNEKEFLKEKRLIEKEEKRYAKPYIDYFDQKEDEMFSLFWEDHGYNLLTALLETPHNTQDAYEEYFACLGTELQNGAHDALQWKNAYFLLLESIEEIPKSLRVSYLKTMRSFHELNRPLLGNYRGVRKKDGQQLEKHLAAAFYPVNGYGYGRSQAYRQAATQGSIFKLITAYGALIEKYEQTGEIKNPLEIIDQIFKSGKDTYVGYTMDGKPIPRFYKGGLLPRSLKPNLGKMDLLRALETSSNPYFSLLASDIYKSPEDLIQIAKLFSYGSRTGIDLPAEIAGQMPTDLSTNRTGLYATAIGQHTLVVTPLQTAVMLSALVNGGKVIKPKIVGQKIGSLPARNDNVIHVPLRFPYQEELALAGVDFPLFTSTVRNQHNDQRKVVGTVVQRKVFMPLEISRLLMEGMRRVVAKDHADAYLNLGRVYREYPEALADYKGTKNSLLGKTSTSESIEQMHLDLSDGSALVNHIWFGGIAFNEKKQPELVVVVYLRYGGYGKAAAPLAAQMVKKWREIRSKYEEQKIK